MKKTIKFLTLVLIFFFAVTTTSCGKKRAEYKTCTNDVDLETSVAVAAHFATIASNKDNVPEGKMFLGLLKDGVLYVANNGTYPDSLPKGTYEIITVDAPTSETDSVSLPTITSAETGINAFAGWYKTSSFQKGDRMATVAQLNASGCTEIYLRYITLGDAGLTALVCIIIVFSMLALLWGIVSLFKFIAPKEKATAQVAKQPVACAPQKAFTMADIKDDDMMAAALVATIDYHNETNENVRVVSIKEIK